MGSICYGGGKYPPCGRGHGALFTTAVLKYPRLWDQRVFHSIILLWFDCTFISDTNARHHIILQRRGGFYLPGGIFTTAVVNNPLVEGRAALFTIEVFPSPLPQAVLAGAYIIYYSCVYSLVVVLFIY